MSIQKIIIVLQSEKVAEQPTEEANKAKKSRTKTKEATDVNEKN